MNRTDRIIRGATIAVVCFSSSLTQVPADGRDWHVGDLVEVDNAKPAIRCTIVLQKESLKVGDHPEVAVQLINESQQLVNLVGSLDDSERKLRYPHVYFEVFGPLGGVIQDPFLHCGHINTLRDSDFVEVPPGGRFDPFANDAFFPPYHFDRTRLAAPGTYTIVFHYSTDSDDLSEWHAEEECRVEGFTRVTERLRLVPRTTISCSVDLSINE